MKFSIVSRNGLVAVLAIAAMTLVACNGGNPDPATVVLHGGRVHTMDDSRRVFSAVALRGNEIVAVGSDSQIRQYIGPQTDVVNLGGRMVLPGFIDTHIHTVLGSESLGRCSLGGQALGVNELLSRVQECLDRVDPSEPSGPDSWFEVVNVNPAGLELSRRDLDRLTTDRPVLLRGGDYHTAWLNSRGVVMARLAADMTDAELGSNIRRDANSVPTGFVTYSLAIQRFIDPDIPPMTMEQRINLASRAIRQHNSMGITSIQDALVRPDVMEVYEQLGARGKLSLRVRANLATSVEDTPAELKRLQDIRTRFSSGHPRIRADGVKILVDGVLEYPNQTAAVNVPYRDPQGGTTTNSGTLNHDPDVLKSFITKLDKSGFSVHMHVIGDKAARVAVDSLEAARHANGRTDGRHTLAHLQLVQPTDIERIGRLGLSASMSMLWAQPDEYTIDAVQPFIDPAVFPYMYPAGSLIKAGATLVGGSDWPVSSENPLWAMRTGVMRDNPFSTDRAGQVLNEKERVSLDNMIAAYTINAAKALRQEKTTGSIEVGKIGDLVILDRDITLGDVSAVGNAAVQMTFLDGVRVFEASAVASQVRAAAMRSSTAQPSSSGHRDHSGHGH